MLLPFAGRSALLGLALLLQGGPQIPAPRGLVNDFANVFTPEAAARMERIAQDVRDKSKGEIAVVTLPDLQGRPKEEIALRIGREWKVGNLADIGDASRNAGVVILIVPKETSSDGGHCRIEVGRGAEGFLTDGTTGEICREATEYFKQRDYSGGTTLATLRVAQRFAQEFNFALDTSIAAAPAVAPRAPSRGRRSGGINPVFIMILFFVLLSMFGGRRRGCGGGGCLPIFLPFGGFGGGGRGGGGGWGGGGFGGGGGGGFGGFGGGGGFSGGGGGSDW